MSKKILLCVDDETNGLVIRKLMLERSGYEVLTADSGEAGLDIFQSHSINGVVLDYFMPGMHGGEVAARMKKLKPGVPILLLSAYVTLPEDSRQHFDACLPKGQSPKLLLDMIAELVQEP